MINKGISGKTKICALIGDPVEHTMSPAMHNAAYKKLGLDYVYIPFRVSPEQLPQAVAGLRALNVRGFNITIPHKVNIIPLLDSLDPLAEKIGAVNTVVNTDGELRGYNTDAEGGAKEVKLLGREHDFAGQYKLHSHGSARSNARSSSGISNRL